MALAILELTDADETNICFKIDAGTNTHYQLKIGTAVRSDGGDDWVDDVYFSTPPRETEGAAAAFSGPIEVQIPRKEFEPGKAFVQLYTSKPGGKALAVSDVIPIPGAAFMQSARTASVAFSLPEARVMTVPAKHTAARRIANRLAPFARQASIESVLGEIVKIASPVVLDLLKDAARSTMTAAAGAGTSALASDTVAGPGNAPIDLLGQILKSLLAAVQAPTGTATTVSKPSSFAASVSAGNRFVAGSGARYAKPFIFGIDDALIASLVGPILQVLPQLMNAANQKRIEMKKADNQLMGGILSDINRRLMMDKLMEAQQAAKAQGPAAPIKPEEIAAISALLDQLPTTAPAPAATAPAGTVPVTATQSLRSPAGAVHQFSNKAMLAFEFGPPIDWNGSAKPVFGRNHTLKLNPRLVIAEPAPKAPLAKAILKIVLQDESHPEVRLEKVLKLKNVLANEPLEVTFEPGELAHLPPNVCYALLAELRWRHPSRETETRALGACEIVLVTKSFIKAQGPEMSGQQELTDMARYRSFWNKIWEAPVLDAARGLKKYNWELNVTARYTSLLSAAHLSNGIMETKLLAEADDAESPTQSVRGRMKAGMELSVAELNKLIPNWAGPPMLDADQLDAFAARPFLDSMAREFKYNIKLKGRAGQAGMVWVVPVFKLFGVMLSQVAAVADNGQVTATTEQDVQFPLPVAARLIGIRSAA